MYLNSQIYADILFWTSIVPTCVSGSYPTEVFSLMASDTSFNLPQKK